MPRWRIRVAVPGGLPGSEALRRALAEFQAGELRLEPRGPGSAEMTGELVVDLRDERRIGDLLRSLHEVSPQVFISRVRSQAEAVGASLGCG